MNKGIKVLNITCLGATSPQLVEAFNTLLLPQRVSLVDLLKAYLRVRDTFLRVLQKEKNAPKEFRRAGKSSD